MSKQIPPKERNWLLVVVASFLILFGLAVAVLSVIYFESLGWLAMGGVAGGLSTTGFSVTAIIRNDPSWILLDLILP